MTLVRRGFIDHSDSLGATARFGQGDVQWMTAGRGIVHAEMFPLRERETTNPLELFQIWLNLPKADKMVEPYFTMLWGSAIPEHTFVDEGRRTTRVVTVAGALGERSAPPPPPNSWSARPDADVAIWTIAMDPGARWTLPAARGEGTRRTLYFFRGDRMRVGDHEQGSHAGLVVRGDVPLALENGDGRGRAAPPAGPAHRGPGGPPRPVRDEYPSGDRAGHDRLPAHRVRRLAVGERRPGAPARGGTLRRPRRRPARAAELTLAHGTRRATRAIEALASVFVIAAGLAACGAGPTVGAAEKDTLRWDFEDGRAGGWTGQNSQVSVSDERGRGGSKWSLRVEPGEWGATFALEAPELDRCRTLTLYTWCDLAEGKSEAWPQLYVNGENTNQWIGPGEGGRLECGKWVRSRIDLTPFPRPRSVSIQVWGVERLYVDDISSELGAPYEAKTLQARVTVDTRKVLYEVSPGAHGTNFVALWNDTGDSPGAVRAFSQMGLGLVRFPGGVPAQWYDWKEPLASGFTELTPERAWKLARAGGARMIFQTNAATRESGVNKDTGRPYTFDNSAAHQAEWVSFSREKGIDVAFWEIGNEPEMDAPETLKNDQAAVYAWYNEVFAEQARAIKSLDPQRGPWARRRPTPGSGGMKATSRSSSRPTVTRTAPVSSTRVVHWYPGGGQGPWESKRGRGPGVGRLHEVHPWRHRGARLAKAAGVHHRMELGGGRQGRVVPKAVQRPRVCRHRRDVPPHRRGRAHALLPAEDRPQLGRAGDGGRLTARGPAFADLLRARAGGPAARQDPRRDQRRRRQERPERLRCEDRGRHGACAVGQQVGAIGSMSRCRSPGRRRPPGPMAHVETLEGVGGDIEDEDVIFNGVRSPNPARDDLPGPGSSPSAARGPCRPTRSP